MLSGLEDEIRLPGRFRTLGRTFIKQRRKP
jgi:hypothetical protein